MKRNKTETTAENLQNDFYSFYLYIHQDLLGIDDLKTCQWEEELCDFFQYEVYLKFLRGERPLATSEAPIQHGKSTKLRLFACWLIGHHSNLRFNFYTASDKLRNETQIFINSVLASKCYRAVFGSVVKSSVSETIWFRKGGQLDFRLMGEGNTGYASHISLIDDSYRNSDDTNSLTVREKVETRFRSDIMSRRQHGSMIIVLHNRKFFIFYT
ncbi:hypothetical protein FACS1894152_4370 [Bacilli bacterium]|nr:hypothetical protein FACS1894152_4370 [Bacilli bacterium]